MPLPFPTSPVADAEKRLAEFFGSVLLPPIPASGARDWHFAALETELRKAGELFRDYLVVRMADLNASTHARVGDPDALADAWDDFFADHVTGPLRSGAEDERLEREAA